MAVGRVEDVGEEGFARCGAKAEERRLEMALVDQGVVMLSGKSLSGRWAH